MPTGPLLVLWTLLAAPAPAAALDLPEVDWLEITAVVDNTYDCFQKDKGCAIRHNVARAQGFDDIGLHAEMGLAYVVRAGIGDRVHTLLFDFGLSPEAYAHNLELLGVDISAAEVLVLSHGHEDHYAALPWAGARTKGPIVVGGEGAFAERRFVSPAGSWDMGRLDRALVDPSGTRIQVSPGPVVLAGFALSTGSIPLETDWEKIPPYMKVVEGGQVLQDPMDHELALAFHVRGQGLVVLTACAHRGVVNSARAAMALTGIDELHAVLGGMHLTTAPPEAIDATMAALSALAPEWIAPMHCTGEEALWKLRALFPDAYVHPAAGTRYRFGAP